MAKPVKVSKTIKHEMIRVACPKRGGATVWANSCISGARCTACGQIGHDRRVA